jgi:glucuronate isomerase
MDEDFLLTTDAARRLYHTYAAPEPIFDYHCHIPPAHIAEDKVFADMAELWLGADHYKWRLMRWDGADESLVTGGAPGFDKFVRYAEALSRAPGSPLYHWSHLELRRYFGITEPLSPASARRIFDECGAKLPELSARTIISRSNVAALATTDDPIDDLRYHRAIAAAGFKTRVLPAFRPDKAVNIDKPGFWGYIEKLGEASGSAITDADALKDALARRMDFFGENGCLLSDHGLDTMVYVPGDADAAFRAARAGCVTREQADAFKTEMLLFCCREYAKRGWATQFHYGAIRNANTRGFEALGPDAGFDCVSTRPCADGVAGILDALSREGSLPKVVLYSLNPNDDAALATAAGCFQGAGARGRIQHGSAWWFNDTKRGMRGQLANLADLGVLGDFIGMLTDSRSLLSYTRHEYFRRILCGLIGEWVDNGEYPEDYETLGGIIRDIAFGNSVKYFGLRVS